MDEITAPVTIRRKKKWRRVDQDGHRERQDVEGQAHRQHRDARAGDDPRREVVQRDRAAVLIEQAPAIMLRGRASADSRVVVTGSAAPEAACAARQAAQAQVRLQEDLEQRVVGLGIERPTPKVAIPPYLTVKELGEADEREPHQSDRGNDQAWGARHHQPAN